MKLIEADLHDRGYKYTGPDSMYNLTWIEIFRLIDGLTLQAKIHEALQKNIRPSDHRKFEEYEQRLKSRR